MYKSLNVDEMEVKTVTEASLKPVCPGARNMSPEASVVALVVAQFADPQNNKLRDNKPPLSQL